MKTRLALSASVLLAATLLAACASAPAPKPDDGPDGTSLRRYTGLPLTLSEFNENRGGAISVCRVLAALERDLHEQSNEARDAEILVDQATRSVGSDLRTARELWLGAERVPPGAGREVFHEYGYYGGEAEHELFAPRNAIPSLGAEAARLLETHADMSPRGQLLAGWRHFAPEVRQRAEGYLASSWRFELVSRGSARVSLCDSLLGPFERSRVEDAGDAYLAGPIMLYEGYRCPQGLMELVVEGPASPVAATISALARVGRGEKAELPVLIAEGYVRVDLSKEDRAFLSAALKGLSQGYADVADLPLNCRRFDVTFSYLVDLNEARATLGFKRIADGWSLEKFVYEPAAAQVMRRNVSIDMMEMVAAAASGSATKMISARRK
ncbi:MAG: hypothetical protein IT462_10560 [Planctomycetes bacterium]|nr:hypothetical protein [Planctomycetota bacterium]